MESDYKVNRLKSWEHFITMMISVLAGCASLPETCMGLEAYEGKLNHINIKKVPPRSTLSDANKRLQSLVFLEADNHVSYWENKSESERLDAACFLIYQTYGTNQFRKVDRTISSKRKRD